MIGYLEGRVLKKTADRILLVTAGVGYEVLLPGFVAAAIAGAGEGDPLSLYIYYQQSERQPRPFLIGFTTEAEKEFFQQFITVEDIGPMRAVKALSLPVAKIAEAVESGDIARLTALKGVGKRTAQKIVAALGGRMGRFLSEAAAAPPPEIDPEGMAAQVVSVLVDQLGHKPADARRRVIAAIERPPAPPSAEALLDRVLSEL